VSELRWLLDGVVGARGRRISKTTHWQFVATQLRKVAAQDGALPFLCG
jgi:hypothetical protein